MSHCLSSRLCLLLSLIPLVLPARALADPWPAFSPGSDGAGGITLGMGFPKDGVNLSLDAAGYPVVAWASQALSEGGAAYAYVLAWNGVEWGELGVSSAHGLGLAGRESAPDRLLLDPMDGHLVITFDHYRNFMFKYDGEAWLPWAGGGINDSGGLEFYTALAFQPDGAPVAAYQQGVGPHVYRVRVRRWGNGWQELGAGSASGSGLSDSASRAYSPNVMADDWGRVHLLWQEDGPGLPHLEFAQWEGDRWLVANGLGPAGQAASLSRRSLALDQHGRPLVAWASPGGIGVQRRLGGEWSSLGAVLMARGESLSEPVLLACPEGLDMVVLWQDSPHAVVRGALWTKEHWVQLGDGDGVAPGTSFDAVVDEDGRVVLATVAGEQRDIQVRAAQACPTGNRESAAAR